MNFKATPMPAEEMVRTVFARVRAADPAVADLYAEDARLDHGDGVHQGRAAIAAFYRDVFVTTRPQPQVEALFVNLPVVAALLRVAMGDGSVLRVVDVFHVEDGAIQSMSVCRVPEAEAAHG